MVWILYIGGLSVDKVNVFLQGLPGDRGIPGSAGAPGPKGEDGEPGARGPRGEAGATVGQPAFSSLDWWDIWTHLDSVFYLPSVLIAKVLKSIYL